MSDSLKRALEVRLAEARRFAIDPHKLDSRPSDKQQEVLQDTESLHVYVVAGNQTGKSAIGARITAWKFEENHPYWTRSSEWGDEPLLIIVAGRVSDQLNEIWRSKIRPYLTEGCYSERYAQGVIKEVTHKTSKNKILFTSHDKAEQAKDKVQSFVAHHFWLDEMPSHAAYIEEAHRRVDAKRAQFIATFTPKVKNEQIRHMVDNADKSIASVYRMGKLDNPIYHGREEEEWKKIAHLAPRVQNNIMFGDWLDAEDKVFNYDIDVHKAELPSHYSSAWPHVISVDPALSSLSGLTLLAYDKLSGQWWVVESKYIREESPTKFVDTVHNYCAAFNIIRRTCDTEPWFYTEYWQRYATSWLPVSNKVQRKKELIANVQQKLEHQQLMHKPGLLDLEREYSTAEWKEGYEGEKIKNSQRFHLLDSLQYALDVLPNIEQEKQLSYDARLMEAARESRLVEAALKKAGSSRDRQRIRNSFNNKRKKKKWYF